MSNGILEQDSQRNRANGTTPLLGSPGIDPSCSGRTLVGLGALGFLDFLGNSTCNALVLFFACSLIGRASVVGSMADVEYNCNNTNNMDSLMQNDLVSHGLL
jgi:hypothetical protein